jgi:hypothetical protein
MRLIMAAVVSLFVFKANALIWFEPMVSYEASGTTAIEYTAAGQASKGVSKENGTHTGGVNYGGRLGYLFDSNKFWFAGEYMASADGQIKYDTHEDKYTRESMGADIGMWFDRWNLWVGYNFQDTLNVTRINVTEKDVIKGTAIRLGIGYMIFRHVVLNVEGALRTYTEGKSTTDTVTNDFPNYIKTFTQTTVNVGLSFPF